MTHAQDSKMLPLLVVSFLRIIFLQEQGKGGRGHPQVKPIKLTRPELEPEFEPSRGLFDISICGKLIIVLPCSFHLSMNAVCKAFDSNIVSEVFRQTSMFLLSVTIPKTKMMSILLNTD